MKVRVVATAATMRDLPLVLRSGGITRLESLGLISTWSERVDEVHRYTAGSRADRVLDLHDAFETRDVGLILSVYGGYNSNQLLDAIDFNRIRSYSPFICGYSDFTAVLNACVSQGVGKAIHGPSFASFCSPNAFDYTIEGFLAVLHGREHTFESPLVEASDLWFLKQGYGPREVQSSPPWWAYREGIATGTFVGGNLETLSHLIGTPFMPDTVNRILFVEDTTGTNAAMFHRDLTHLRQSGYLSDLAGLVVGRVPSGTVLSERSVISDILDDVLTNIRRYPVLIDVNCSHVDPMITLPLYSRCRLEASQVPRIVVNC